MREIKRFQNLEIILVSWSGIMGHSPDRVNGYLESHKISTLVLIMSVLFKLKKIIKNNYFSKRKILSM